MSIITLSDNYKEVRFDKYCNSCKHFDAIYVPGEDNEYWKYCEPCLSEPANQYSEKPVNWEEK